MQIEWTIEGEKQLSRRLQMVSTGLSDFTDAFKRTAEYLKDAFEDSFDTQGKNIGVTWPKLAQSTIKQKSRNYPGAPMMVRTGVLRNGFMNLYKTDMAMVWNSVNYFKYHQSNKSRARLPRRIMMNLGNEQKESVVKFFQAYILKTVGR
jgi:phage gpG-like protein